MLSDRERQEQKDLQRQRDQLKRHGSRRDRWDLDHAVMIHKASFGESSDLVFMLKVLTLPLWVPMKLLQMKKRSKEIKGIVGEFERKGRINETKEMAAVIAKRYPDEYPYGDLGSDFAKLESRFRKAVSQRKASR